MAKIRNMAFVLFATLITTSVFHPVYAQSKAPSVSTPKKSVLEHAKEQADADLVKVTKALDLESAKAKDYDACKVVQLETEQEYDQWFIDHYSEFERTATSIDDVIKTANDKISTLREQSVTVNAVPGQTTPAVEVNLEKMVGYFKLFNDRVLTCSKNAKQALQEQMENPNRNPLHIAHSQILTAMKTITTNLNASLKEQGVSYEIAFKPVFCGYELMLKVKLTVADAKKEYDFSLLNSKGDTDLTKIVLDDEAKWSALSKGKIDKLPVDGMLRYRTIQDRKAVKCDDLTKIPSYRSNLPFSTYADLLTLAKTVKKEGVGDGPSEIEFVSIDGGTFMMGSPDSEPSRNINEVQHAVTLTEFEMGVTLVTQKQWFSVMGNNPSNNIDKKNCPETYSDENGGMCPNNPVENVSYDDIMGANGFLAKLNANQDGYIYRLPTEAEWEYSAKAGATTTYSFGNDENQLKDHAWYDQNSENHTHEVGKKGKNAFELYDMGGNLWEMVSDWFGEYSTNGTQVNPQGQTSSDRHVIRGGDYSGKASYLRPSFRTDWGSHGERNATVGFRLVRTPQ